MLLFFFLSVANLGFPLFFVFFFHSFFFSGGSGGERCGWSERCVRLLKGQGSCRAALKGWRAAEVGAGKEVAGGGGVPAAGGWRGVPAALKSGWRRRSRPGQRNGEGPVRAKGLAEIGMGPGAVKAVTGGLEVLRGGRRARHGGYGAWADGRVLGEGEARVGGHAPQGAPAGGAPVEEEEARAPPGSPRTPPQPRARRAKASSREGAPGAGKGEHGGGDPWEEEPLPREREREGEGERRAGSGGAAGAAAGAPGGAGAAKATCPPSRSQAATDRLTCEPSVAPATSTPWRVRIAGSMNGPGARRRILNYFLR